jgi:hypothetical protein
MAEGGSGSGWGFNDGSFKDSERERNTSTSDYGFLSPDPGPEESPYAGFLGAGGDDDGDEGGYDNLPELVCLLIPSFFSVLVLFFAATLA